jgi:beta-N-acetylhexosaminidase
MKQPGHVVISVAGEQLSAEERELIAHPSVAGVILLQHNFHSPSQIRALAGEIKKIKSPLIIACDHEGGRVQLLRSGFTDIPAMREWGKLYQQDPLTTKKKLADIIAIASKELRSVGLNLNFAPVLDMDRGHSKVIGERSFGDCPMVVAELAQVVIKQMRAHGMPAVGKHFPGHGAVANDSHLELPIDNRSWEEICSSDLKPFVALANNLDAVMSAHILYPKVDQNLVTFSRRWLQDILRKHIGFKGIIISDDLNMSATAQKSGFAERAVLALEAGCDLLIACHNQQGIIDIVEVLENWQDSAKDNRLAQFISHLS